MPGDLGPRPAPLRTIIWTFPEAFRLPAAAGWPGRAPSARASVAGHLIDGAAPAPAGDATGTGAKPSPSSSRKNE